MNDQVQAQEYWEYSRAMPSYPLQRSDVEAPRGSLVACSQFLPTPLFVPHVYGSRPDPREQHWWRVILDVAPFAPSEISLWIRDSFLKVTGTEHWLIKDFFIVNYFHTLMEGGSGISFIPLVVFFCEL